ncbi:MAG: hypothetical protein Q8K63_13455 [Acidimicrobiales bacterium]|nr:hypothetical protein [Acidimicrobiales bacterium]
MRKLKVCLVAGALLFAATGCGDDDDSSDAAGGDEAAAEIVSIDVTATDYAFAVPASITGGTVEMNYENNGKEPHFAAFAKINDGKTFADAKAVLTAPADTPASGPPPFAEWAGSPTADPGGSGKMTFDLPAGTYALFCSIPAADGVSHAAKGMVTEVTVTAGETVEQPEAAGTVTAADFSLTAPPELEEGSNVVALKNDGKQLHEINLIELPDGKTVDDVIAWFKAPNGPPPNKSLSGVAVAPGQTGTATVNLTKGSTYAFICVIPDVLSDFAPHLFKGMATGTFTV